MRNTILRSCVKKYFFKCSTSILEKLSYRRDHTLVYEKSQCFPPSLMALTASSPGSEHSSIILTVRGLLSRAHLPRGSIVCQMLGGGEVWRSLAHLLYNQRNTNKKNSHTHSTHTMSRCHPTLSGFALSLSMGRVAVPTNNGAATPHCHAEVASYRGRTRCRWFACLGGFGHCDR